MGARLSRAFFARAATTVAPELLGCVVRHGPVAVRITEVEAYGGAGDPASHAARGLTPRTAVMFGPAGHAYVYLSYGMHWCLNLVTGPTGDASAVLLRAGEVIDGHELMPERRPGAAARDLARGPARLTRALGVARESDGADLCVPDAALLVEHGTRPASVVTGPRVGISVGVETPWRFWAAGDSTVSPFRPGKPRRAG